MIRISSTYAFVSRLDEVAEGEYGDGDVIVLTAGPNEDYSDIVTEMTFHFAGGVHHPLDVVAATSLTYGAYSKSAVAVIGDYRDAAQVIEDGLGRDRLIDSVVLVEGNQASYLSFDETFTVRPWADHLTDLTPVDDDLSSDDYDWLISLGEPRDVMPRLVTDAAYRTMLLQRLPNVIQHSGERNEGLVARLIYGFALVFDGGPTSVALLALDHEPLLTATPTLRDWVDAIKQNVPLFVLGMMIMDAFA